MIACVKQEMEGTVEERSDQSHSSGSDGSHGDSFWGAFEKNARCESDQDLTSIDAEIQRWSGLSSLSRTTNPLHAMDALKSDYPRIFRLFRKYCVSPSTQNRDERIFSLVVSLTYEWMGDSETRYMKVNAKSLV